MGTRSSSRRNAPPPPLIANNPPGGLIRSKLRDKASRSLNTGADGDAAGGLQCLAYSAKEKQSSSECDLRASAERLRYQLPREKVVGLA